MPSAATVALALVGLVACTAPQDEADHLTVLGASSLRAVFEKAAGGFDGGVTFGFAASSRLVAQIQDGAAADVVATADEASMDALSRARLLAAPAVPFATNRLAIAVAPANPEAVRSLADLARPGLDVALAAPAVPAGRLAGEALSRAGVGVRPVSLEDSAPAVAARVERGEADAGVTWVTEVRGRAGLDVVDIPDAHNVRAVYLIAVLRASDRPAAARRFVELVRSGAGQRVLAEAGFGPP
ncbi:MAG: molybdate ABC transporter substrate-binding protein [Actinomycetota bacterium]|nr:molybdate ABC transporter substrate-binding protein [Actinomycetota bacterium]